MRKKKKMKKLTLKDLGKIKGGSSTNLAYGHKSYVETNSDFTGSGSKDMLGLDRPKR